jgi:hypothetical protein
MNLEEAIKIGLGGFIVGFLFFLGIPDVGESILIGWGKTSGFLLYNLTPNLYIYITIVGIIITLIGLYFVFEPVIEALKYGIIGMIILVTGFLLGLGVAYYLLGLTKSIFYNLAGII